MHLGGCTDLAIMQGEEMQHLEIGRFAQKYHVNFDWLLAGDLKGCGECCATTSQKQRLIRIAVGSSC